MIILVVGGTGFVGSKLRHELVLTGHEVIVLTRDESRAQSILGSSIKVFAWDDLKSKQAVDLLKNVECVVNLAGESIGNSHWTKKKKERILNSRIDTTREIISAIESQLLNPKILVNASAIGFYGPCGDEEISEYAGAGKDFLANVCKAWEEEAFKAEKLGLRVSTVRIGLVLGKGGALDKMTLPFKFFMGGTIGVGTQWVSWVHIDDLVKLIRFVIETNSISGPVNAAAPQPVNMQEFCKLLGKVMNRPSWLNVPGFMLRIILGEMSGMLLNGQRVMPKKILQAGYNFKFPTLKDALEDILTKDKN